MPEASLLSPNNPFSGLITQIDAFSVETVIGETRLGTAFCFLAAKPTLELLINFMNRLRPIDGIGLPGRMQSTITSDLQEIIRLLTQMQNTRVENVINNQGYISNLTQEIKNLYEKLIADAVPAILYSALLSSGIESTQQEVLAIRKEIQEKVDAQNVIVENAKDLLSKQKEFSAEIAIAGYGTLFVKEAKKHATAAKCWLVGAILLAVVTCTFAWVNYIRSEDLLAHALTAAPVQTQSIPATILIQFTLAKVVLFTIGLSAAFWSARVYRSHSHNSVINRHRANALTSFQEFADKATDPDVKNAVLLQTTACIYAPQPSGFSGGSDNDGESPLKILEIVRSIKGS